MVVKIPLRWASMVVVEPVLRRRRRGGEPGPVRYPAPTATRDGGGLHGAEKEGRRQADGSARLQGRQGRGPGEGDTGRPLEGHREGRGDHESPPGRK